MLSHEDREHFVLPLATPLSANGVTATPPNGVYTNPTVDALVVVDTETPEREDGHEVWWHGGYLAGLGAAEWAKVRMLEQGKLPDKDP